MVNTRNDNQSIIRLERNDEGRRRRSIQRMFIVFAIALLIPIIELPLIHKYYLQGFVGQSGEEDASEEVKGRLNILVLYADDWRYDSLGSLGKSIVKTPVLDELAKEGMLFSENCVTTALCWISRATLHTGQYLSRHQSEQVWQTNFYNDWNTTYPGQLRNAGYHVGHVGKWHYRNFPSYNYDYSAEYMGWHLDPVTNIHVTKKNEMDAIHYLQTRPKDKLFCLTVAFFAPHAVDDDKRQFIPQDSTMSLYTNDTVSVPISATQDAWEKLPYFIDERNEGRARWHWRFDEPNKYQRMMKNYYRLISEIDTTCGKIMQELKDQGVYNTTLIIFTTDNGYFHGEHGLADKWYAHQESIRVPLIIRDPRMYSDYIGTRNDKFTLNIDLAPTIISAANLPIPKRMQGKDMSLLYRKKATNWRTQFFYEHPTVDHHPQSFISSSQALVTKTYKYIVWTGFNNYDSRNDKRVGFEQLFDLANDPFELNDVVNYTNYSTILNDMRQRFLILREEVK